MQTLRMNDYIHLFFEINFMFAFFRKLLAGALRNMTVRITVRFATI